MCIFCCLICSHIYWIIHQHNERTCLLNAFMVVCTFWHALSDILFISICMYILRWNIWVYLCEDRLITCFIIALYYMSSKNFIDKHISSLILKSNLLYFSLSRIVYFNTQNSLNIGVIINVCMYLKYSIKASPTCKQDIAYDTYWTHCL